MSAPKPNADLLATMVEITGALDRGGAWVPCQWRRTDEPDRLREVTIDSIARLDGPDRFAVRLGSSVLNRAGEWEHEPSPSNRDDAFFTRCRFATFDEARAAADKAPRS